MEDNINYSAIKYVKNRRFIIAAMICEIVNLYLILFPHYTIDWSIQWTSANLIVDGVPLYEQKPYSILSEKLILPPHHFPIFFYLLAFIALSGSELLGLLFLWLMLNLLTITYFLILRPRETKDAIFLLIITMIHPAVLGTSYFRTFDTFTAIFIVLAYYFYTQKKLMTTGLLVGIGVGVKFSSILVLIPMVIITLNSKKYSNIGKVLSSFIVTIVVQGIFYISYFNNFLEETILWQSERQEQTFSFFSHFTTEFFESRYFIVFELVFLIIVFLILLHIERKYFKLSFWTKFVIFTAMFIFVYRTHYGHYGYWLLTGLIPLYYSLYVNRRFTDLLYVFSANMLYYVGAMYCLETCYTLEPLSPDRIVAVVIVNISLFLISLTLLLVERKENIMPILTK